MGPSWYPYRRKTLTTLRPLKSFRDRRLHHTKLTPGSERPSQWSRGMPRRRGLGISPTPAGWSSFSRHKKPCSVRCGHSAASFFSRQPAYWFPYLPPSSPRLDAYESETCSCTINKDDLRPLRPSSV